MFTKQTIEYHFNNLTESNRQIDTFGIDFFLYSIFIIFYTVLQRERFYDKIEWK